MGNHVLLSGIPGTGKTTVGNFLRDKYGFIHYNFEDLSTLALFAKDIPGFITRALSQDNVVITWGFMPYGHTEHVIEMKRRGFTLIWFDGNRDAAYREFMKRGAVSEDAYKIQMSNVISSNVIDKIQPTTINTFDRNGQFKKLDEIVKEMLKA